MKQRGANQLPNDHKQMRRLVPASDHVLCEWVWRKLIRGKSIYLEWKQRAHDIEQRKNPKSESCEY